MNDATVFVFATAAEARPLLDTFDAEPLRNAVLNLYVLDDAMLMICGGSAAMAGAAIDTLAAVYQPRRVVLGGLARRLHDGLSVGGIAQIGAATFDRPQRTTYVPVSRLAPTELAGARGDCTLLSRSTPLLDSGERARLAMIADLLDGVGATVASVCVQHGIECAIFKAVGAYAGERALSDGMTAELHTRLAAFLLGHYDGLIQGFEAPGGLRATATKSTRQPMPKSARRG